MQATASDSTILQPDSAVALIAAAPADSVRPAEYKSVIEPVEHKRFDPEPLAPLASSNSALTALLVGLLVVVAFSSGGVMRAIRNYSHELWSIRRRPNVFDEESSIPLHTVILLSVVFVVFGGIGIYNLHGIPRQPGFAAAAASMGIAAAYFLFQYTAYTVLGFAFADKDGHRQLVKGYMASQAISAVLFIVPAFLLVYKPLWREPLIVVLLSIYCIIHLLFIGKGLRIFYRNYNPLLYFILYLCSVEIIPALALYRISEYMWEFIA